MVSKFSVFLISLTALLFFCSVVSAQTSLSMESQVDFGSQDAAGTTLTSTSVYDPLPDSAAVSAVNYSLEYSKTETSSDAFCTLSFAGEEKNITLTPTASGGVETFQDTLEGTFANYPHNGQLEATLSCDETAVVSTLSATIQYSIVCNTTLGSIIDGYCVCYSSYEGADCTTPHTATCEIPPPDKLETINPPSLDTAQSFSNGNLHLIARSGFVENRQTQSIRIGSSNNLYCSFPGPFWGGSLDQCDDTFTSQVPWEIASTDCDLTRTESNSSILYEGQLEMLQEEPLGEIRGKDLVREFQSVLRFRVRFPTSTDVTTTSIDFFAPVAVESAMLQQSYNTSVAKGFLTLFTSVQWPFALHTPTVFVDSTGLDAGITLGEQTCGATSEAACEQNWIIDVTALENTCELDGFYNVTFGIECRDVNDCPLDADASASAGFTVDSEDFCAVVEDDINLSGSLETVGGSSYFPDETVTLQAGVSSPDAVITGMDVAKVTTVLSGTETVIHNPSGSVDTSEVQFAITSSDTTQTDFQFVLNPDVYPIAADDNQQMTVEAVLSVTYENTAKRTQETRQVRAVMENKKMEASMGTKFVYGIREESSGGATDKDGSDSNDASILQNPSPLLLIVVSVLMLVLN